MYLTAADAAGMMVSFIQSNYMGFGSGVVVPGTGISLQNRGTGFVAAAGASELRRAAKAPVPHHHSRLRHARRPAGDELRRDGRHHAAAGPRADGGAHRRLRPEPAGGVRRSALPLRAGHGRERRGAASRAASLEELQRRGHRIVTVDDYNQFGSAQMIWKLDGGYLHRQRSAPRRPGRGFLDHALRNPRMTSGS